MKKPAIWRREMLLLNGYLLAAFALLAIVYRMLTPGISWQDTSFRSQPGEPLAKQLLWFHVDGLRADFAFDPLVMPTVASLAKQGTSGTAHTSGVTLSLPALKALTTGGGFTAREVLTNFWGMDQGIDSLFLRARQKEMNVAFSGPPEWVRSFQKHFTVFFSHKRQGFDQAPNDRDAQEHLKGYLLEGRYQILVVHYLNADMTAHNHGARDGHYADALRQIDAYIRELIGLARSDAAILVTSDHGITDEGFHWDLTDEVVHTPFVLAGSGIERASGLEIHQMDLAATLAALLGLDFPTQSEGGLLLAALKAAPEVKAKWATSYAAARLRALEVAGLDSAAGTRVLQQAQEALAEADYSRAIAMADQIQQTNTQQIAAARLQQSHWHFAMALVLGLSVATVILLAATNGEGPELASHAKKTMRERIGMARSWAWPIFLMGCLGIWFLSAKYQGQAFWLIPPFRYPFLVAHWKEVALTLCGVCLAVPLVERKINVSAWPPTWRLVALSLFAALFGATWQAHDLFQWVALAGLAAFCWRSLVRKQLMLEAVLFGSLFVVSSLARRVSTLEIWYLQDFGVWLPLLAIVAFLLTSGYVLHVLYPGLPGRAQWFVMPIAWREIRPAAWLLFLIGLYTQLLRAFVWNRTLPAAYVLIAACVLQQAFSRRRAARDSYAALTLAVLAVAPLLMPAYFFPVVALAAAALSACARRSSERRSSAVLLAALVMAGILFLFFGLNGFFDLKTIEGKRLQLLNPYFEYDYRSVFGIGSQILLQLSLPAVLLTGCVAYRMRNDRRSWLRFNSLVHLLFLVQLMGPVVSLYYGGGIFTGQDNSLHRNLSQFFALFCLYVLYHLSVLLSGWMIHPAEQSTSVVNVHASARAQC